jgi:cytochrome c peroxidase
MANENAADLVARMRGGGHAEELRKIFGEAIFDHSEKAFAAIGEALEVSRRPGRVD